MRSRRRRFSGIPVALLLASTSALAADRVAFTTPDLLGAYGLELSRGTAVADFDGDGRLDVAMACRAGFGSGSFVRVWRSSGPRRFRAAEDWAVTSSQPLSLAVDDSNADGFTDIVNVGAFDATVLFGDGAGGFVTGPTRSFPQSGIAGAADVDGDGRVDVLFFGSDGVLRPYYADGAGAFVPGDAIAVGIEFPYAMSVADIDRDGALDVVLPRRIGIASSRVDLARGDGLGGFLAPVTMIPIGRRSSYLFYDADADGDLDAFAAQLQRATLVPYENAGAGSFVARSEIGTVIPAAGPARAVDENGDGILDILVAAPTALIVLPGAGGFAFGPPALIPIAPGTSEGMDLVDIDADGAIDFFQPVAGVGTLITYAPPGGGFGTTLPSAFPAGLTPRAVAAADLNRDGRLDLAVANRGPDSGNGSVTVFSGDGSGGFALRGDYATGARPHVVTTGDFDGDGLLDVAVGKLAGSDVNVLFGDGTGALSAPLGVEFTGPALSIRALDANEDGVDDLMVKSDYDASPDSRSAVLRLADGARGFAAPLVVTGALQAYGAIATGDLDLDGHEDVVARTSFAATVGVEVFYGDGLGGFPRSARTSASSPEPLAVGDVDGDGLPDVVTGSGVVPGRGALGLGILEPFEDPIPNGILRIGDGVLADFDSDGRLDLVGIGVAVAPGDPSAVAVLRGTGGLAFERPADFATADGAAGLAVGDFDRDCHPDVAVATASGVTVLFNRSLDAYAVRAGTVNAAAGPVTDVLFVNGSAGAGAERRVIVARTDPFELRVDAAPSRALSAFALYAWLGEPNGGTVQLLPRGLGRIAMPTPLVPGCRPLPRQIWNNLGFPALLGAPTLPSSPAPSVVVSAPGGLGGRVVAYLQGFIRDAAAPNGRAAVTNGIVLDVR